MAKDATAAVMHVIRSTADASASGPSDCELLRRFADSRDQAAFAALVRRHGPLVLGVCRRVLPNLQDAEDACQATFLVLAQKAKSNRWQPSIANWLYATARKVAGNARVAAQRRARRESHAAIPVAVQPVDQMTGREFMATLDEELDKLPSHYREPLLLCYLEGLTHDEAARRLHIPAATIKTRLERGRKRLCDALTRRGCVLGAGLLALAATSPAEASPSCLVRSVLTAVTLPPPAAVVALTKGVVANGLMSKSALMVLALAGTIAIAAGLAPLTVAGPQRAARQAERPPVAVAQPTTTDDNSVAFSGRVVGPDGKPVAGAKLYLTPWWGYDDEPLMSPESATSGADGRFTFTVAKAKYRHQATVVSAAAPNFGVGWIQIGKDDTKTDLTVKLVADDVPITGQIVDLEGKPVSGATLRVLQIKAAPTEDLGPFLVAAKAGTPLPHGRSGELEKQHLSRNVYAPSALLTTDAAGRLRLAGIGRERLAIVQLDGPTIASQYLRIRTRPGDAIKVPDVEPNREYGTPQIDATYYGADFRHAAGPTKAITGIVRDKDTKRPLGGVTVLSEKLAHNPLHGVHLVRTRTDDEGRYRLVGMPIGAGNKIKLIPPGELPYITPVLDVPGTPGVEAVTVDVEMKRAVWVGGKITDKKTGRPVRAEVMYLVRQGNPNRSDYPGYYGGMPFTETKEDGTYRVLGLPGPGLILVYRDENYLLGAERDDEDGLRDAIGYMPKCNFAAFARIDPAKEAASARRDIALVPGWTFTGTLLGPDGQPLAGAQHFGLSWGVHGLLYWAEHPERMKGAEFTVRQFNPRRPRPVFFRHPEKGLIGVARPPKEDGGSVTVRMESGAALTGRLVDADGKPQAGMELKVSFRPKAEPFWDDGCYFPDSIKTDREGRFRIDALLPGFNYFLNSDRAGCSFSGELRAGETQDLGEVRTSR